MTINDIRPVTPTLSDEDLQWLDDFGSSIDVGAGRVLLREGTPGREAILIRKGSATVTRDGQVINHVGAGELVGELALLYLTARTATVTTDGPAQVAVLNPREFASLLAASPDIRQRVVDVAEARRRR